MKKTMNYDEVRGLLDATFRIIDAAKTAEDPLNINTELQFLILFVDTMVSRSLGVTPKAGQSKKQQYEILKANYGTVKFGLQESIAFGFQDAVSRSTNQSMEFHCIIKPAPEPTTSTNH